MYCPNAVQWIIKDEGLNQILLKQSRNSSEDGNVFNAADYGIRFGKLSFHRFQDITSAQVSFRASEGWKMYILQNLSISYMHCLSNRIPGIQVNLFLKTFNDTWYNDVSFILIQSLDLCTCNILRFIMVTLAIHH